MGKEAKCHVRWGGESGEAKVLLETLELIVRPVAGMADELTRRSVPVASLSAIAVLGDELRFCAGEDAVTMGLGETRARSWAKKMAAPPPTLAAKLGIAADTRLGLIGKFEGEELAAAIGAAGSTESATPELVLAMVRNEADLDFALDLVQSQLHAPPVWVIYAKGAGHATGEAEIRDTLRQAGWMDTKVASVSATLTALRFHRRGDASG